MIEPNFREMPDSSEMSHGSSLGHLFFRLVRGLLAGIFARHRLD